MHVNDLPPELIHLIFKSVLPKNAANLLCWKEQFNLLHVCQKWRQCALPLIYSQALLIISDSADKKDREIPWLNNLDLISSLKRPMVIRSVKACLSSNQGIQPTLDGLLLCLSQNKTYLGNVKSFSLELCISKPVHSSSKLNSYLEEKAGLIKHVMPNIQSLTLYGSDGNDERQLSKHLCQLFLPQLSRMVCQYAIPYAFSPVPVHLTMLQVTFRPNTAICLPHSLTETLQYLHMHCVPQDYFWSSLLTYTSGSKIVFSKLTHFSLSYNTTAPAVGPALQTNERKIELCFPKLQTLFVCGSPSNCKVLTASKFPSSMRSITAVASVKALEQFQHVVPSRVGALNISTTLPMHGTRQKFSKAINMLFGQVLTDRTHLVLDKSIQLIEPSNISWKCLQKLMISTRVGSALLLEIIHKTPSLQELAAFCIYIDDKPAQRDISRNQNKRVSNIEALNISFDMDETTCTVIRLVKHMLIQLPRLKRLLCTALIECSELHSFIKDSQQQYPYLAEVSITSFP